MGVVLLSKCPATAFGTAVSITSTENVLGPPCPSEAPEICTDALSCDVDPFPIVIPPDLKVAE